MFKKKKDNVSTDLKEIKPAKKKNKKLVKRIVIGVVVVVILALIFVPKMFAPEILPMVKTEKATIGDIEQILSTSGFVESEETKTYYSDVNAKIMEFSLKKGSVVHGGDLLVSYDTNELENQYKQQELQAKASKADYAQALAESSENATKYHNSSTDVNILEQQVEDQQNAVEHIQVSLNDEANYLSELQAKLSEVQVKLEDATKENKTSKIEKYTEQIKEIKNKIKDSNNYTTDLNNNLLSAQNELGTLQSNLSEQKSIKSSSETGILSNNQKTQKAATTEVTTLTLEQAMANLEKAKSGVSAAFSGVITDVQVAEGATVAQGTPLFTIASNEVVKLTVALTKYDLENVREGQKADITLGGNTYTGEVSKISRVATTNAAGAAVINAEIHINNPDDNIYLGVEAKVKIKVGSASGVVLVPVECINTDKSGAFCYVLENGIVVKKAVTTGLSSDEYIEIKDGIKEGEEVVAEFSADVTEGTKVTSIPADGTMGDEPSVSEDSTDVKNTNTDDTKNSDAENSDTENSDKENADTDSKDAEKDSEPAQE